MPNMAQRSSREVKSLLIMHEGGTVTDRWFCRRHDKHMYGQWGSTAEAQVGYERHIKKYHPEMIGKKPKIERVD